MAGDYPCHPADRHGKRLARRKSNEARDKKIPKLITTQVRGDEVELGMNEKTIVVDPDPGMPLRWVPRDALTGPMGGSFTSRSRQGSCFA
jgi:hypothetical protein